MNYRIMRKTGHFLARYIVISTIILTLVSCGGSKTRRIDYTTPGTKCSSSSITTVLNLINETRSDKDLAPLTLDPLLTSMAQAWSETMARDGFCAHVHPKDRNLDLNNRLILFNRSRLDKHLSLLKLDYISENVGFNADASFSEKKHISAIWKGFMRSRPHKNNILSKNSSRVGIGIARGTYKTIPACFITQIFGRKLKSNLYLGSEDL